MERLNVEELSPAPPSRSEVLDEFAHLGRASNTFPSQSGYYLFRLFVFAFHSRRIFDPLVKCDLHFLGHGQGGLGRLRRTLEFITELPGSFYNRRIGRGITRVKIDRHIRTVDTLRERFQTLRSVWFTEEIKQRS